MLWLQYLSYNHHTMAKTPANQGKQRTSQDLKQLEKLAVGNTPTPLIAYKLWRSVDSIYTKASDEEISLHPVNQSPYNRLKK